MLGGRESRGVRPLSLRPRRTTRGSWIFECQLLPPSMASSPRSDATRQAIGHVTSYNNPAFPTDSESEL